MSKFHLAALSIVMLGAVVSHAVGQDNRAIERQKVEAATVARVVLYSEIMYLTKGTLEAATSQQELDLAALRTEISAHTVAQDALAAAGLGTQDVVAMMVTPGGVLVLYVDDL
jgi:hypothetical protein